MLVAVTVHTGPHAVSLPMIWCSHSPCFRLRVHGGIAPDPELIKDTGKDTEYSRIAAVRLHDVLFHSTLSLLTLSTILPVLAETLVPESVPKFEEGIPAVKWHILHLCLSRLIRAHQIKRQLALWLRNAEYNI